MICYLSASEHLAAKEKISRYSVFMFAHQLNRSLLIVCRQPSHNISSLSLEKKKENCVQIIFLFSFLSQLWNTMFSWNIALIQITLLNSIEGVCEDVITDIVKNMSFIHKTWVFFPNIVRCSSRSEIFLELGDGIWDYYYLRLKFGDRQSKFGHKISTSLHEVHSI